MGIESWFNKKTGNLTGDRNPANPELVVQPREKENLYEENPDPNKLVNPNPDSKIVDPNNETTRKFKT